MKKYGKVVVKKDLGLLKKLLKPGNTNLIVCIWD